MFKVYQCKKCKSFVPILCNEHIETSHFASGRYNMPNDMGELVTCSDCNVRQMALFDRWYDTEYEYPMHESVRPKIRPRHWFSGKRLQNWSWSVAPIKLDEMKDFNIGGN